MTRADHSSVWISFKYECLSSFCILCGRITHTMGACVDIEHPYQYALGDEIRGMIPMDEMEAFQSLRSRMSRGDSDVGRGSGGSMGRKVGGGDSGDSRWVFSSTISASLSFGTNRVILENSHKDKSIFGTHES